ncbi:uncharacterized protein BT62DRAFT_943834 [Guyanagaster necrorhizus]|uniref:SMP domain-containing protein n=1 Tax=Guyanagaster necrorhizus TaxID=856835 RepID=A0A9P7W1I6_9AGAR|nr:uncharacterized protein BT62DRAFT_943834 [Guyanagaster necrorhizus MCA 3950]KAG7450902.1 hypothetical protein BT62DRAFT_943834 [Guyanagaster necrorhizus MCA 3950]
MAPTDESPTPQEISLDATHIAAESSLDLSAVGKHEARKIMSLQHKVLGYRPPPGSLASEAQAAASKHPDGISPSPPDTASLREAALKDAARIGLRSERSTPSKKISFDIDLDRIGLADARKLMSEEHKALGYRPPPGSLAAEAQVAAAKHPEIKDSNIDPRILTKAAQKDAARIASERGATGAKFDRRTEEPPVLKSGDNASPGA